MRELNARLPPVAHALTLFATGLIVIAFEYVDGEDADVRATERLRQVLTEQAPATRDAVIDGFAFDAHDLARVSSADTLDQVVRNSLAIRLGDADMAARAYRDLRSQVVRSLERWHDLSITVTLSPASGGYPTLTTRCSSPRCATSTKSYRRSHSCASPVSPTPTSVVSCWPTPASPKPGTSSRSLVSMLLREVFSLIEFSVNGAPRPIRRTQRKGAQAYSVALDIPATAAPEAAPSADAEPITVAYTYCVLVQQLGHLLYLDLTRLCKDVTIQRLRHLLRQRARFHRQLPAGPDQPEPGHRAGADDRGQLRRLVLQLRFAELSRHARLGPTCRIWITGIRGIHLTGPPSLRVPEPSRSCGPPVAGPHMWGLNCAGPVR